MSEPADRIPDDELILSVQGGRIQDFEILVHRYSRKIVNFINRMIGDPDESQSLSQEAFLKVFEHLRYYKRENNFSAFLFKVAKNLTLNHIKRQRRTLFFSRMAGSDARERNFSHEATPAEELEGEQRDRLLEAGLLQLSEEQRLALILKVYLDFSYKQIVDITGWSVPKVETLISRAKSALKKILTLQETPGGVVS